MEILKAASEIIAMLSLCALAVFSIVFAVEEVFDENKLWGFILFQVGILLFCLAVRITFKEKK